jgi:6-phosphogluconolactonase
MNLTSLWLAAGAVLSAAPLALGGSAPRPPSDVTWSVYFGTDGPEARGIYRSSFDATRGKLSAPVLAAEIGSPGFLALHPAGDKLYAVANFAGGPGAAGYSIGAGGELAPINTSPTGAGGGAHLAVHPSGKFLLTAQYGSGTVALFPLDAQGRLGPAKITRHDGGSRVVAQRQDAPHPHWCGYSPDGRFALVPDLGLDGVVLYRVDEAQLTLERHGFAAAPPGSGPRHLRFSPDGEFIYLLNELALSVTAFAWDRAAGAATPLATTPTLTETAKGKEAFNSAAEILVHRSGRFVYASNRGHDTVTVFQVDPATAALEALQLQPIRGAFPRHIQLSPDGAWLLAAGADSNTVSVHRVDPRNGTLTYITRSVVNVPAPICILFATAP